MHLKKIRFSKRLLGVLYQIHNKRNSILLVTQNLIGSFDFSEGFFSLSLFLCLSMLLQCYIFPVVVLLLRQQY
jgi:hypothetical protein